MTPALLALALSIAAPGPKDGKKDPDTLLGEWEAESLIKGGRPGKVSPGTGMTFAAGGKVVLREKGKDLEATFTADPKKGPPELEIVVPDRAVAEKLAGVYRVDGDTLTLCLGADGARATAFESPAGSKLLLMVLKRAKKKE